ncbi:uncharacterized protein LOC9300849 isoform X3 [Arabidopsis lyrata subsp. lyrata]|uniref:uncharacterized protein LOC9300849 isoform X3 n=1 Tax=Arabidopsis lyrata subsp. lyrata TaxID=81972 RepID=UPI000A29CFB3|nr:uncharacterized protein LOC9300849 isoform X3 [Arabidopsis lyrata subsp. lyrata]|eukprot:XP_020881442.1 uncharacterized protein LOC9300849 isoform X3 [Arabidopsis lyrata subsp. lyrata]
MFVLNDCNSDISRFGQEHRAREALSCGALCFMRQPISHRDLNVVCEQALRHKMNGETDPNGSKQNGKRPSTNDSDDGKHWLRLREKPKLKWTKPLQSRFMRALKNLGVAKAVPKTILQYMNVDGISRSQIASHLQKYRKHMRKVKERAKEVNMAKKAMKSNVASSSNINPQLSYKYVRGLSKENLFKAQLGDGPGQPSILLNNNDSIYSMHDGPTYDLSQNGSNLLPMGESLGFSRGVLPLNEESRSVLPLNEEWRSVFGTSQMSQVPSFGQYGTPSDISGMNSNLDTGYTRNSYAGISIDKYGHLSGLGGERVSGNDNGYLGESLDAMNWNLYNNNVRNHGSSTSRFLHNKVQPHHNFTAQTDDLLPRSIFDTSQAPQVPSFGQYGITNDVIGMNPGFGTGYMHNNYTGINTDQIGNLGGLGGARVYGDGNVSLGQNSGTINWNFDENNMSNYGSSNSRFSSPLSLFNEEQSLSHLNAQTDELVPVLENLSLYNDHQSINPFSGNSNFLQYQHQGQVSDTNFQFANHDQLEKNAMLAACSTEDINNLSINNVKESSNEETLNSIAANLEMLFPTHDMNIINQHQGQVLSGENREFANDNQLNRNSILATHSLEDINYLCINNVNNYSEKTLNSFAANSEMNFPALDVNTMNQEEQCDANLTDVLLTFDEEEQGLAALTDVPLPFDQVNNSSEKTLNSFAANSEMNFPASDVNTMNQEEQGDANLTDVLLTFDEEEQGLAALTDVPLPFDQKEQGVADLTDVPLAFDQEKQGNVDVPLPFDQEWKDDDLMNFMLDLDDMF